MGRDNCEDAAGSDQAGLRPLDRAAIAALAVGVASAGYNAYDLKYPGHFVGDMYGLEVMFRVIVTACAGGPLLLGIPLLAWGIARRAPRARTAGAVIVMIASVLLVVATLFQAGM